jgi:hypothetical protein
MNASELKTKIREITHTNDSDYPESSLIRDLNHELTMIQIKILHARGTLEFDDPNFADLPYATFDVVSGQRSYKILTDDNNADLLTKHKVSIKKDGDFHDVPRMQLTEQADRQDLIDVNETQAIPSAYFEAGKSIIFRETPSQPTTGKVWFDRELSFLSEGDTKKEPGVPSAYHHLAAYRTAHNYAIDNQLPNEEDIRRRMKNEEDRLGEFEETRRNDEATIIRPRSKSGL